MTLNWHTEASHIGKYRTMPRDDDTNFFRRNCSASSLDTGDFAILLSNRSNFAVLDDIHAAHIRTTGKTPGHCIVACNATAWLKRSA